MGPTSLHQQGSADHPKEKNIYIYLSSKHHWVAVNCEPSDHQGGQRFGHIKRRRIYLHGVFLSEGEISRLCQMSNFRGAHRDPDRDRWHNWWGGVMGLRWR